MFLVVAMYNMVLSVWDSEEKALEECAKAKDEHGEETRIEVYEVNKSNFV